MKKRVVNGMGSRTGPTTEPELTMGQRLALMVEVNGWVVRHMKVFGPVEDTPFWNEFGDDHAHLLRALASGNHVKPPSVESSPLMELLTNESRFYSESCEPDPPPARMWDYVKHPATMSGRVKKGS